MFCDGGQEDHRPKHSQATSLMSHVDRALAQTSPSVLHFLSRPDQHEALTYTLLARRQQENQLKG